MKTEVEIDDEQCECITIKELKLAVDLNLSPYEGECPDEPDWELLAALVLVLRYFTTPTDLGYFELIEKDIQKQKERFTCGS